MRCDPCGFDPIFMTSLGDAVTEYEAASASYSAFVHPDYDALIEPVRDIRIALKGERAIREAAVERNYVTLPEAMIDAQGRVNKRKARPYLLRGSYPEVVKFTQAMNVGKVFAKPYKLSGYEEVAPNLPVMLGGADTQGLDFLGFAKWMTAEKLGAGLSGVYVQLDETGAICFRRYIAENIINWAADKRKYTSILLKEDVPAKSGQPFRPKHDVRLRHLHLMDGRAYETLWVYDETKREFKAGPPQALMIGGRALTALPFVFDGIAGDFNPPFDSLFRLSLSAYQASCELNHVHWKCSQPQAYIRFDEGGHLGPSHAAPDAALAGGSEGDHEWVWGEGIQQIYKGELRFAEMKGDSLEALAARHQRLLAEMATRGARLGVNYGHAHVSENTERMRQGGELSFIVGHILSTSHALQSCIRWGLTLLGKDEAAVRGVHFALNTDLTEDVSRPSLDDIHKAVEGGYISRKTAFETIKTTLKLGDDVSYDNEQGLMGES